MVFAICDFSLLFKSHISSECFKKIANLEKRGNIMDDVDEKTLCALQEEGYIESHTEEFIRLISNPKFFCKNCGRSAVNSNNLCKPAELP